MMDESISNSDYLELSNINIQESPALKRDKVKMLTSFQGALQISKMSLCYAITGLPFAFLHLGLLWGFVLLCFLAYLSYKSCLLYLKLKEIVPGRLNSIHEAGY